MPWRRAGRVGRRRAPVAPRRRGPRPQPLGHGGLVEGLSEVERCVAGEPNEGRRRQPGEIRGAGQGGARPVQRDLAAVVEDEAAVHPPEHRRVVLGAQDGGPAPRQRFEQVGDRRGPGRIELGGRFVEDEDARAHRHDARDRDPLLLATGQGERLAVGEVGDPQPRQRGVDPRVHLGPRDAQVLEPEGELLAHRLLRGRQLVRRRREHDADPPEQRVGARRRRSPTPPISTRPSSLARTTRGMNPAAASASVDLPAPVRPATPTRSPAATSSATPSRLGTFLPG